MSTDRVTLTNPATRAMEMRAKVNEVAESIILDYRADSLFEQVMSSRRHVHNYSIRNRILQQWQAPLSRLIASLGTYEKIAADQGAETTIIGGRRKRVMIRAGARAVWVWGRYMSRSPLNDSIEDGQRVDVVQYRPMATWAVEDIVYAATAEAMILPDHVQPIDDRALYDALVAFAAHKQIEIVHTGIVGARGLSHGGRISLQHGDSEALQLPVLTHEIMHELLHHNRESMGLPKGLIEGECQGAAGTLLRMYGHDEPVTAAYLRNHNVQPNDVLRSMDRILKAVNEVVEFIEARSETDVRES